MNQVVSASRKKLFIFLLTIGAIVLIGFDIQRDDGIVGTTRKNGEGCVCHSFAQDTSVHVWISGPKSVQTSHTVTYAVHLAGGPAQAGGFNVASGHGSLGATNSEAKLIGDELAHSAPKSFTSGEVAWSFTYQAPPSSGPDTLFSAAISSNQNMIPDEGDRWNFGDDFAINVTNNPPAAVPIFSRWGIVVAFIILFVVALWSIKNRARRTQPTA